MNRQRRRRSRVLRELAAGEYAAWGAVQRCVPCFEAALCEVLYGGASLGRCSACGRDAAGRAEAVGILQQVYCDQAA